MRVLVDNTGIHAVGRCLDKRSKGPADALGLLQLATQLVFCETIIVQCEKTGEIGERTAEVLTKVEASGVSSETIQYLNCTQDSWSAGCVGAAKAFADDVADLLPQEGGELEGTAPEFRDGKVARDGAMHDLIVKDRSREELDDLAGLALKDGATRLVEYCFAACPPLWDAVRRAYVERGGWARDVTARLAVLLRVYCNDAVACRSDAHYAPAVPRSELIRGFGRTVEDRLMGLVNEVAGKLAHRPVQAPSLYSALLHRGKAEPNGILREACALREKTGPLRSVLSKVASRLRTDDVEGWFALEKECQELCELTEMDLGLRTPPQLRDALEVKFIFGVPAPTLSATELVRWLEYRWKRRRVTVLTELSKAAAFVAKDAEQYKRLLRKIR